MEVLIGEAVEAIMSRRGIDNDSLIKKTGYQKSYLSEIRNDKKTPSYKALCKLARAMEVEPWKILKIADLIQVAEGKGFAVKEWSIYAEKILLEKVLEDNE